MTFKINFKIFKINFSENYFFIICDTEIFLKEVLKIMN